MVADHARNPRNRGTLESPGRAGRTPRPGSIGTASASAGNHCAQPLMRRLGVTGTVRASVHVYSAHEDIDALVSAVSDTREIR